MKRTVLVLVAALALPIGAGPALSSARAQEPQLVAVPLGQASSKAGASEARRQDPVRLKLDDGTAESVIGLTLRDDPTKGLQAVVVNNKELGVSWHGGRANFSASVYRSYSKLGSSLTIDPVTKDFILQRRNIPRGNNERCAAIASKSALDTSPVT